MEPVFNGIKKALKEDVSLNTVLMPNDVCMYRRIAKQFALHEV